MQATLYLLINLVLHFPNKGQQPSTSSDTSATETGPQITLNSSATELEVAPSSSYSQPPAVSTSETTEPSEKLIEKATEPAKPKAVTLDLASPISLDSETVIMVKGRKCALRVDPSTNQLVAYPIRPPNSTGMLLFLK